MLHVVQYGVNAADAGNLDGARGQSLVAIGIVGTVDGEQFVVDALQLKLFECKLDGGVGLQGHVGLQAVEVHACYHGLLSGICRLLVNDAGQRAYLVGCQSHIVGFGLAVALPEAVVLIAHACQQGINADIPIDVVGVGHKHCRNGAGVVAQLSADGVAGECLGNGGRVEHQAMGQHSGQTVHRAHLRNGEAEAFLLAVLQVAEDDEGTFAGLNGITACANMVGVAAVAYQRAQSCESCRMAESADFRQHRVLRIVAVDIQKLCGVALRNRC